MHAEHSDSAVAQQRMHSLLAMAAAAVPLVGAVGMWLPGWPWPLTLLSLAPSLLLAGGVLGVIAGWRARRGTIALLGGATVLLTLAGIAPLYMAGPSPTVTSVPLRVLSANVYTANQDAARLLAYIAATDPDVIVLQEADDAWLRRLAPLFARYPHRRHSVRLPGHPPDLLVLWRGEGVHVPEPPAFCGQHLRLEIDDHALHLFNVHTASPFSIGRARRQVREYHAIAYALDGVAGPVVVAGDFNAAPWSPRLRGLLRAQSLRQARRGYGVQPTWPSPVQYLGIPLDHVFVRGAVAVAHFAVGPHIGSDHRPIVVDLVVGEGEG